MSQAKVSDKALEGAVCCTVLFRPTAQGGRADAGLRYCNALVTLGSEMVISRLWLVTGTLELFIEKLRKLTDDII